MTRHHLIESSAILAAQFDPDTVTPGVIGFIVTFAVAAIVVLLMLDMTRRIRRTRYRVEIAERLDAEQFGTDEAVSDDSDRDRR